MALPAPKQPAPDAERRIETMLGMTHDPGRGMYGILRDGIRIDQYRPDEMCVIEVTYVGHIDRATADSIIALLGGGL